MIVQFLTVAAVYKHLGDYELGKVAIVFSVNTFAAVLIGWLSGGSMRLLSEAASKGQKFRFGCTYTLSKVLYTTYATLVVVCGLSVYFVLFAEQSENAYTFSLAGLYLILLYSYAAERSALSARKILYISNLAELCGQCIFCILALYLLQNGHGIEAIFYGQILGIIITHACTKIYRSYVKEEFIQLRYDIAAYKDALSALLGPMGRSYTLYGAIVLCLQSDVIFLGLLTSPDIVGRYYLIWKLPEVFILLILRIPSIYSPYLVSLEKKRMFDKIKRSMLSGFLVVSTLSLVFIFLFALCYEHVFIIWLGENPNFGMHEILISSVAGSLVAVSKWFALFPYATANLTNLIKLSLLELATRIIVFLLLVDIFLYLTPIIAIIIAHVSFATFGYFIVARKSITALKVSRSGDENDKHTLG